MPLTDLAIRQAKPGDKPRKLSDERGLYIEIRPTGGKYWRYRYKIDGVENVFAIGEYPELGLADARAERDRARTLVKQGRHPANIRRAAKAKQIAENGSSFKIVALEWIGTKSKASDSYRRQLTNAFTNNLFHYYIGKLPVRDISSAHLLDCLRRMQITEQQLLYIMPNARRSAGVFVPAINSAAKRWQINTPRRMAAFLAQVGDESGQLQWTRELGNSAYLAKYDTGPLAERLGNTPEADGDGQLYRGRGLIQITVRYNYLKCSAALFGDDRLLREPQLLEQPEWAAQSAGWYWWVKELNTLADQDRFTDITRKINGGVNGQKDRLELWGGAREVCK